MERGENRTSLFQAFQVLLVIIGHAFFPAAKQAANLLERQGSDDGVILLALARVVFDVVSYGSCGWQVFEKHAG